MFVAVDFLHPSLDRDSDEIGLTFRYFQFLGVVLISLFMVFRTPDLMLNKVSSPPCGTPRLTS